MEKVFRRKLLFNYMILKQISVCWRTVICRKKTQKLLFIHSDQQTVNYFHFKIHPDRSIRRGWQRGEILKAVLQCKFCPCVCALWLCTYIPKGIYCDIAIVLSSFWPTLCMPLQEEVIETTSAFPPSFSLPPFLRYSKQWRTLHFSDYSQQKSHNFLSTPPHLLSVPPILLPSRYS